MNKFTKWIKTNPYRFSAVVAAGVASFLCGIALLGGIINDGKDSPYDQCVREGVNLGLDRTTVEEICRNAEELQEMEGEEVN